MPRVLPTGTVTFLFTDVEGSTRLLHELGPAAYSDALVEHRRVVREAFASGGGVEVDTQGDAFFFAFPRADSAVTAAQRANDALDAGPIRIRIGIHTGTPHVTDEGYVGEDVHLGARVAAAGHGGQVLLTRATRDLLDDTAVRDLGEHRVKDFDEPVWIYQLGGAGFPPLKTISNTNLPRPASSFVGRGHEVEEVVARLRAARIVTLSGPGGSGKTRLAIEAAFELVPEFRNGVFWVALATLRDPQLVLPTIAHTLGARDAVAEHLGERELLLLLDNLEQVVEAAPELGSLVQACPNLKLLVTSRELMRIPGEVELPVLPLATAEAIDLFVERSRLEPDDAVAELCLRLDNLPLAVELAAARTSVLSSAQILERLSGRLDLLKAGRGVDPRQQTLRETIGWSHDLLSADEQRLFARLAVFAGCTLDGAEQVCAADLDTLQSLVDKSLVRHTKERFWMLETIREFALERLDASGEGDALRRRHAAYFLEIARTAQSDLLRGVDQLAWHPRLDAELDNIRAVLDWAYAEDPVLAAELTAALGRYWWMRAANEGMAWLEHALSHPDLPPPVRAAALEAAGGTAWFLNEPERTAALVADALELYRELGDRVAVGRVLNMTGPPLMVAGRHDEAESVLTEALVLNEDLGAEGEVALSLNLLAHVAYERGDIEKAVDMWERSNVLARRHGILWMLVNNLHNLAESRLERGDLDEARALCREALVRSTELGEESGVMVALGLLSRIVAESGDEERAGLLLGAAERLDEEQGESHARPDLERYREQLGDRGHEFETARAHGRILTLEEATALAEGSA